MLNFINKNIDISKLAAKYKFVNSIYYKLSITRPVIINFLGINKSIIIGKKEDHYYCEKSDLYIINYNWNNENNFYKEVHRVNHKGKIVDKNYFINDKLISKE